jgi:hypothetical protein
MAPSYFPLRSGVLNSVSFSRQGPEDIAADAFQFAELSNSVALLLADAGLVEVEGTPCRVVTSQKVVVDKESPKYNFGKI